jgi:hypothetical protein
MSSTDLMGGYAAYTTPNAAVEELAATSAVDEAATSMGCIATFISGVVLSVLITQL